MSKHKNKEFVTNGWQYLNKGHNYHINNHLVGHITVTNSGWPYYRLVYSAYLVETPADLYHPRAYKTWDYRTLRSAKRRIEKECDKKILQSQNQVPVSPVANSHVPDWTGF